MRFLKLALPMLLSSTLAVSIGCQSEQDKPASPEYLAARSIWTQLLDHHQGFDAAVLAPEFEIMLNLLDSVPSDPLARAFKKELLDRRAGTQNKQRDQQEYKKELIYQPPALSLTDDTPTHIETRDPPRSSDPRPPGPEQGMSAASFKERFGDCFILTNELDVAGLGKGTVWNFKKSETCLGRLPDFVDQSILIVDDTIESVRATASLQVVERIFFEGREITKEERSCLEENHRRALKGDPPISCKPEEDPYQAPMEEPPLATIESL